MASDSEPTHGGEEKVVEFDVVIVGAGFAGLFALYHIRRLGFSVRAYEHASDVGGTWYWNRYPGARVDNESMEYSFSFSEELQQEWSWTERFASQPELLRYFDHVANKFDLRKDIQFNTRISLAAFDESKNRWTIQTDQGDTISAQFCLLATGILSAPKKLDIAGLSSFKGATYATSAWPHEPVDFSGQRVGIIGTGSSGIQAIPHLAEQSAHLTVFQRTANYATPACNRPVTPEFERLIKSNYAEVRRRQARSVVGGVIKCDEITYGVPTHSALQVTASERVQEYERCWASANFTFYSCYKDILKNREANETVGEFVRAKIREKVRDPKIAKLLIPTDYLVLTKRLSTETGYFETYNRDNVTLVDVKHSPIEAITAKGVRVNGFEHELDAVVFATGFDAMTGAVTSIDIHGRGGRQIRREWAKSGPRTSLGLMSAGFPNLFYLNGPTSPSALFGYVLVAEFQVRWIGECLQNVRRKNKRCIEPTVAAEDEWIGRCQQAVDRTLLPLTDSWYMGANIPGKPRVILSYLGGFVSYQQLFGEAAANDYQKFVWASC